MKSLVVGAVLLIFPYLSTTDPRTSTPGTPQTAPEVACATHAGSPTVPFAGTPQPIFLQGTPCRADQVYHATYYYQSSGGQQCGTTFQYCYLSPPSPPRYHEGCTTSYYTEYFAPCYCP